MAANVSVGFNPRERHYQSDLSAALMIAASALSAAAFLSTASPMWGLISILLLLAGLALLSNQSRISEISSDSARHADHFSASRVISGDCGNGSSFRLEHSLTFSGPRNNRYVSNPHALDECAPIGGPPPLINFEGSPWTNGRRALSLSNAATPLCDRAHAAIGGAPPSLGSRAQQRASHTARSESSYQAQSSHCAVIGAPPQAPPRVVEIVENPNSSASGLERYLTMSNLERGGLSSTHSNTAGGTSMQTHEPIRTGMPEHQHKHTHAGIGRS